MHHQIRDVASMALLILNTQRIVGVLRSRGARRPRAAGGLTRASRRVSPLVRKSIQLIRRVRGVRYSLETAVSPTVKRAARPPTPAPPAARPPESPRQSLARAFRPESYRCPPSYRPPLLPRLSFLDSSLAPPSRRPTAASTPRGTARSRAPPIRRLPDSHQQIHRNSESHSESHPRL